jgi:hypothetical protein
MLFLLHAPPDPEHDTYDEDEPSGAAVVWALLFGFVFFGALIALFIR